MQGVAGANPMDSQQSNSPSPSQWSNSPSPSRQSYSPSPYQQSSSPSPAQQSGSPSPPGVPFPLPSVILETTQRYISRLISAHALMLILNWNQCTCKHAAPVYSDIYNITSSVLNMSCAGQQSPSPPASSDPGVVVRMLIQTESSRAQQQLNKLQRSADNNDLQNLIETQGALPALACIVHH